MRLFIPYLASSTNAGIRQHWGKRKREVDDALWLTLDVVLREGIEPVKGRVDLVFTPRLGPKVRRRDTSNYSMTVKHLEDALVAAGILPDDRIEYVRDVTLRAPVIDRDDVSGTWVEILPCSTE